MGMLGTTSSRSMVSFSLSLVLLLLSSIRLLSALFVRTDPTYFPNRSAKIFYRPPLVAGAHITFAPVASADAANATATVQSTPSTPAPTQETSSGPLDKIKEALSSALPGSGAKAGPGARDVEIGQIGILHPSVLKSFELDYPCSSLEFDVEQFL